MATSFHAWEERVLSGRGELEERGRLLESRGLTVPAGQGLVLGFFEGERLAATGSLIGDIVQGVAVAREMEGEGAAATVATALIKAAMDRGLRHLFLYSKPEEATRFEALGFSLLAEARLAPREPGATAILGAALLEWGFEGIAAWRARLAREAEGRPRPAGAVVVNCNPFTLGHRYLIERAAASVPWLYVLVVEEDRSLFPFDVRIELVRRGTADIPNLSVLAGGPYVISSATFPSYFIRSLPGEDAVAELHAAIDLEVFRNHIAPALGATERFVGTEPYCPTTSAYNRLMKEILPGPQGDGAAIRVREMPRLELGGVPVSASRVRELIRRGTLDEARPLVPASTWAWLSSEPARPILEHIRSSDSRH